ncbi:hypothetical protein BGZ81_002989 [Podila clonocystis]|nr:hypothetical protein BGZ81_002989 [Podila clonocystis]
MTSLQPILRTGTTRPLSVNKILGHTTRAHTRTSLSRLGIRTNKPRNHYSTNRTPTSTATQPATSFASESSIPIQKQSRFRQYAEQFKNKPASHLISFGILHEITAIVPLPIIYFGLVETGIKIPFPEQAIEEGNRFVGKVAKYYGWNMEGADGARMMLNMATSYAVVKALMPLRLALCVWMTPWTATRIVSPIMNFWRRFKK